MLERATAKSPGGGGRDHPLKLGPEAGSLPAPALLRLQRPSVKWLETAFAEDVGGALLAFRAGRRGGMVASRTERPLTNCVSTTSQWPLPSHATERYAARAPARRHRVRSNR